LSPALLNRIGLLLGLVGVILIFVWGPPQPNLEKGVGLGLQEGTRLPDGRTVAEHDRDVARRRRRHTVLSRVGLGLIALAFVLQLIATF